MYGTLVRQLNNVEAVASMMLSGYMAKVSPYDIIDTVSKMTSETVLKYIRSDLNEDKLVMSVIEGNEND